MNSFLPNNDYHTSDRIKKALFPSFHFYRKMFSIVVASGLKAKNNPYTGEDWATSSFDIFRALESVGIKIHVTGMNAMDEIADSPCVFIGNHMSVLETFVLPSIIQPRKETTFVVKQSLVDYPIFKYVMRSRDPIVVGRDSPRKDLHTMLEGGEERLKKGRSIIVFPQSSRTNTFEPEHFNSIGVKLAKRANVPVIPIALKTDAWATGSLIKDFGFISPSTSVHFAFGKPMTIQGNGKEDHAKIVTFITDHIKKWESEK